MQYFKTLVNYLKDNPNHYWFRRKIYGWGWVPATREGWLVVVALVAFLGFDSFVFSVNPANNSPELFILEILLAIGIVVCIGYLKGEKPAWRWGFTPEEKAKYGGQDMPK